MVTRTLVTLSLVGLMALAGCSGPQEVYNYKPEGQQYGALKASEKVELIDITEDAFKTYLDVQKELEPHVVLGTFNAVNRETLDQAPVIPKMKAFAKENGAHVIIYNCGVKPEEPGSDKKVLVCAGQLIRYSDKDAR